MISRAINFAIWLVGAGVIAYVVFFVPVGKRTLSEHAQRIWATPEAQELQTEVKEAARQATEQATAKQAELQQAQTE